MQSIYYAGEPQPLVHRHCTGQTETVLTSFTLAQQYIYRLLANQGVIGSNLIMGCIPFITDTDLSSINDFVTLTFQVRFVTSSMLQARTARVNQSRLSPKQLCIPHHIPCGDHVNMYHVWLHTAFTTHANWCIKRYVLPLLWTLVQYTNLITWPQDWHISCHLKQFTELWSKSISKVCLGTDHGLAGPLEEQIDI